MFLFKVQSSMQGYWKVWESPGRRKMLFKDALSSAVANFNTRGSIYATVAEFGS